jgi:hypothetical protein
MLLYLHQGTILRPSGSRLFQILFINFDQTLSFSAGLVVQKVFGVVIAGLPIAVFAPGVGLLVVLLYVDSMIVSKSQILYQILIHE